MYTLNDEFYMGLALDLAQRTQGQTGINPVVGSVVVKDGAIVGVGTHLQRGTPHAEVHALNMAGDAAKGSTVYVSLEPCSHYGATPPCSERLITEQVARVVVACEDPNPQVAGRGIEMLRRQGIEVEVGVLGERALQLNTKFIKYITTGLPYVTVKTASTLDGKIASRTGDSRWISNEASREMVHTLRHRHQAIMVGVGTVIADDPQLTTRLAVPGLSPIRIVVDSKLRIPSSAKLLTDGLAETIILTTEGADKSKRLLLENAGINVISCGEGPQVDLKIAMVKLGEAGIGSVLVEGGGQLNGSIIFSKLADEVILFIAPKLIGGHTSPGSFVFDGFDLMREAITLQNIEVEQFGDNICIKGTPEYD